jgi:hypothetical protein
MKDSQNNSSKTVAILLVVAVIAVGSVLAYMYFAKDDSKTATNSSTGTSAKLSNTSDSKANVAPEKTTEEQLVYLIEEEKLAHDVYTVMYQKYGANVFGNILESESTHQGRVLVLLQARNIQDPRSTEVGVFKNTELQNLYNSLIEQGNISATEAYKAGVAIEEKDIKDITNQLATTQDQDIVTTLEALRSGSENHLRAFNRQL